MSDIVFHIRRSDHFVSNHHFALPLIHVTVPPDLLSKDAQDALKYADGKYPTEFQGFFSREGLSYPLTIDKLEPEALDISLAVVEAFRNFNITGDAKTLSYSTKEFEIANARKLLGSEMTRLEEVAASSKRTAERVQYDLQNVKHKLELSEATVARTARERDAAYRLSAEHCKEIDGMKASIADAQLERSHLQKEVAELNNLVERLYKWLSESEKQVLDLKYGLSGVTAFVRVYLHPDEFSDVFQLVSDNLPKNWRNSEDLLKDLVYGKEPCQNNNSSTTSTTSQTPSNNAGKTPNTTQTHKPKNNSKKPPKASGSKPKKNSDN